MRGNRPREAVIASTKHSRLRYRAENNPVRNVISVAREYEAYLARPDVLGYRQVAEHFGLSKVMVGYYLALLSRLPKFFVTWLEPCTESIPLAFFSLNRLRPITQLAEAERKTALLGLTQTLVAQMESESSVTIPELVRLFGKQSVADPKPREHRAIQLD